MRFGKRHAITLTMPRRHITLQLPAGYAGDTSNANLMVAGDTVTRGDTTTVTLKAVHVDAPPLRMHAPLHAPSAPPAPEVTAQRDDWQVHVDGKVRLYVNSKAGAMVDGATRLARHRAFACFSATRVGAHGLESLHSPPTCVGKTSRVGGDWPRQWTATTGGTHRAWLDYDNPHGSIETGVTAAVKMLVVDCHGQPEQRKPLVMPHSVGRQASTWTTFDAPAGATCRFHLNDGFNMSYLTNNSHYTSWEGGASGPLNEADIGDLHIAPLSETNR